MQCQSQRSKARRGQQTGTGRPSNNIQYTSSASSRCSTSLHRPRKQKPKAKTQPLYSLKQLQHHLPSHPQAVRANDAHNRLVSGMPACCSQRVCCHHVAAAHTRPPGCPGNTINVHEVATCGRAGRGQQRRCFISVPRPSGTTVKCRSGKACYQQICCCCPRRSTRLPETSPAACAPGANS